MKTRSRRFVAAMVGAAFWPAWAGAADDASRLIAAGDLAGARLQLRSSLKTDPRNGALHYQLGTIDLELGDAAAAEKEARAAQDAGYAAAAVTSLLTNAYLTEGRSRDLLRDFPPGQGAPELAAAVMDGRGRALLLLGRADEAADAFAEAERLAPNTVAPLLGEAQVALTRNDLATADDRVTAALRIDPTSAEALQRRSALLTQKRDQVGALAAADSAVAAAPGQYVYRLERAGVLITFNRNAPAKADVDAVLAAAPGNARATYYRAILLLRAGDYAGADAQLDKLSKFISAYPGAYLVQAIVKQQLGQTEQALDAATRYVARNPGEPNGAALLAKLELQAKQPAKAIDVLTPLVIARIPDAGVYDLRGTALSQLGRTQEAIGDFLQALKLAPNDPEMLAHAGASEMALNQPQAALPLLRRSLDLAPKQPQTEAALVTALLQTASLDAAQQAIGRLRAEQGGSELVELLNAELLLARFDMPGARAAFEAVLRDHPDANAARVGLARVALLQGRSDDWASTMTQVLQRTPSDEAIVNEVADQLLREGKTADAVGVLERAHAAAPGNSRIMTRLASLYLGQHQAQKALDLTNAPLPGGSLTADATDPNSALPALLVRAAAQVALRQLDAARGTYRQVLATAPNLIAARVQLVRLLLVANDALGAQSVVQEGLLADPQNQPLLRAAIDVDANGGGLQAALASAARLAQDPSHQPASLALEGDIYMAAQRFDDAAKAYADSLRASPSGVLALRLAVARTAGKHQGEAVKGLRDWMGQHPDDLDVAYDLADLELRAGHLDAAEALLSRILAKRPSDARALNNLAWIEQQTKQPQAAALAQRAYQLAPGPETADTWGYIMATEGGGDRGVSLLRLATTQAPNDPALKFHLAVAYQAAGEPAEAVRLLTPLVAQPNGFAERAQAERLLADLSAKP